MQTNKYIYNINISDKSIIKVDASMKKKMNKIMDFVFTKKTFKGIDTFEVSINVLDSNEIHSLNKEYRNIDKTTDVLSFPLDDSIEQYKDLGDMFINIDYLKDIDNVNNKFLEYFTHCLLHLIGYDHQTDKEYEEMIGLEEEIIDNIIK